MVGAYIERDVLKKLRSQDLSRTLGDGQRLIRLKSGNIRDLSGRNSYPQDGRHLEREASDRYEDLAGDMGMIKKISLPGYHPLAN